MMHVSRVKCNTVYAPVILRLEELEFLLYTVQSLQDCELERLARLQGDLHRKNEREDETMIHRFLGVHVCVLIETMHCAF